MYNVFNTGILVHSGFEWMIKFEQVNPEGFTYGQMTLKIRHLWGGVESGIEAGREVEL